MTWPSTLLQGVLTSTDRTFRFHTADAGGIDDFSVSAATRLFRTLDIGVSVNYMKADAEFHDFLQAVVGTGFGYGNVQVDFAYIRTIGEERPTSDFDLGVVELASKFQGERFLASLIFRFDK